MPVWHCNRQHGFTLIEVLVALTIISVALLAALRAAGQGTESASELRSRVFAGWVAQNLLATQRARGDWPPLGTQRGTESQGGIAFIWRKEVVATPNPAFHRVDIAVFPLSDESHALTRLTGFLVRPQ